MKDKTEKTIYRAYFAWNYQKEIEDLNRASQKGWQLVKGGCFRSRFKKDCRVIYRYALDYNSSLRDQDMARYRETFAEQGWEYISSSFNGWHYFRKKYSPGLPESEYQIYTDGPSLRQMQGRWRRFALALAVIELVLSTLNFVLYFSRGRQSLISAFMCLAVGLLLLYGYTRMRRRDA